MVGGYAIPEVNRLMNAFMAGALEVNPDVKFLVSFINSWYDPPKAKEAAFAMIDAGADIMYAERFGVSDAAKERSVLAIGNVIDTSADYPGTILASRALARGADDRRGHRRRCRTARFAAADYGKYAFMEYGGGSFVADEALAGPTRWRRPRPRKRDHRRPFRSRSTTPSRSRRCNPVPGSDPGPFGRRTRGNGGGPDRNSGGVVLSLAGITKRFGALLANDAHRPDACAAARSWRCSARTAPARRR